MLSVKPKSRDMVIPSQALTDRKRNMLIINNKEFYESPYEGYLVSKDGIVISVKEGVSTIEITLNSGRE